MDSSTMEYCGVLLAALLKPISEAVVLGQQRRRRWLAPGFLTSVAVVCLRPVLRAGDDVVEVDERPELGIRRRMAVGIHVGDQPLGVIWVQEGRSPLSERGERALLGAARVAVLQLIRQRTETGGVPRFRENLLTGLLDGRVDAASVAGDIGANAARFKRPAAVP